MTFRSATGSVLVGEYKIQFVSWQSKGMANCTLQNPPGPSACSVDGDLLSAHPQNSAAGTVAIVVSTGMTGQVELNVSRNGQPVQVARGGSVVHTSYPNGPDCDPECKTYTEDETLN